MNLDKDLTTKINKLQGEYLSSNLNQVWTVDITSVKNKYYFFFIVDLASRRVIAYDVLDHDYNTTEACMVLYKALKEENSIKPSRPVEFVHTDSGRIFLSKEWLDTLAMNNILPSSSDSKTHQNQVSERFNRTFKKLLRDYLNKKLKKSHNKTNTFQLIGEATKYNLNNLKPITEEIIRYYNSSKAHIHLKGLTPDAWANKARLLPEQKYIVKDKGELSSKEVKLLPENSVMTMPEEVLINRIDLLKESPEVSENVKKQDSSSLLKDIMCLQEKSLIPFVSLSKNDNSKEAKMIREYKNNVGSLELIDHIKENKIDLSKLDSGTKKMYEVLLESVDSWKNTDIKYLETLMLQNQVLLFNIEELKTKTNELKVQNEELLSMNHYLVETAERAEEERLDSLERKEKRRKAKKLERRDYITPEEFYEIMHSYIYKSEDSLYIICRNRIAFFLMYLTGLRVSNLLLLKVRNLKELMYDNVGTELSIIKGGRPNQLISLGEDAQRLLLNDYYDDLCLLLKNKEDDYPVFTAEKTLCSALHRVTFTQSLNNTMKIASNELRKKLSCHSFRITFITEGLNNNIPLHIMQKAVGHKTIKSTEHYVRHDLSLNEWRKVVTTANRDRVNDCFNKLEEDGKQK